MLETISKRAIILRWMMARSETWLSVTSSAAVESYKYSYKYEGPEQNDSVVGSNSIRIGAKAQHIR